jgi:thiamine biosynthesis lipoprotein ApbE
VSEEPRRIARRALFGRLLPQAPEAGHWVKVHRTAMACRFDVTLDSGDARHVDAARAALDEVDAIEASLSVFREASEVSRLNRQAAIAPVPVSPGLFTLLSLCRELHAATGGAFDPASTALSRCWGFLDRRPRRPADEEIAAARARSGMDKVVLDELGRAVRFAVPGVEIGFGAVGKGWALDRVAASLRVRGVSRALLTAGGSSHPGPRSQDAIAKSVFFATTPLTTLRGGDGCRPAPARTDTPMMRPGARPRARRRGGRWTSSSPRCPRR